MRDDKLSLGIVILGTVLVIVSAVWLLQSRQGARTTVYVGDAVLTAELATTPLKRERGLAGRKRMPDTSAMLFVFNEDAPWPIWMKDMRLALDIVWLDANKKVVDIKMNAMPGSYPDTFVPAVSARYVLEVPAGVVTAKNIRVGSQARFELPR